MKLCEKNYYTTYYIERSEDGETIDDLQFKNQFKTLEGKTKTFKSNINDTKTIDEDWNDIKTYYDMLGNELVTFKDYTIEKQPCYYIIDRIEESITTTKDAIMFEMVDQSKRRQYNKDNYKTKGVVKFYYYNDMLVIREC